MGCCSIRIRDTTKFCCIPIRTACGIFTVLFAINGAYLMFFLPPIPRYILMLLYIAVGFFGLTAIITGKRALTYWYFWAFAVCALLEVLALAFYVMNPGYDCNKETNSYFIWLCSLNSNLLDWSLMIGTFNMFFIFGLATHAFERLSWFQKGVFKLRYSDDPSPPPPPFVVPKPEGVFVLDASIQPLPSPSPTPSDQQPKQLSHWTEEEL